MSEKKSCHASRSRRTSLRSYAATVFRESSVGMVSSLAETPSKRRKCFKVFVLILCLSGFLYQSVKFLTVVLQYPTAVDIDIVRPKHYNAPAYTFCDNNGIKRSLFCEKYPERCEEPEEAFCEKYEDYCGDNKTPVPKKEFYGATKEMPFEEIISLNANRSEFVLQHGRYGIHSITGPYYRVDHDMSNPLICYSVDERVNSSEDPVQTYREKMIPMPIKRFTFYVNDSEMFIPGVKPGILFSIHSPFVAVSPLQNGIFMKPGRTYLIYMSLEEEVLLKRPYETDCINYTEYWLQNGRSGPRSQEMCRHKCIQEVAVQCFNCAIPFFLYPFDEKLCSLEDIHEYGCPKDLSYKAEDCENMCKDDCKRTKYSYSVQERYTMKFDQKGHVLKDTDRLVEIIIYLEDEEVIVLQHSPKYMIVEVFSTIGGFIGGWLGISLLDVTDIFEGFFRIIRYAFK